MALHSQTIGFQAKCVADSRIYYDFALRVEEVSIDPINNRSEIFYTCTAQQSGITFTGTTRSVAATVTIVINTESRSFNVALKKTAEGNFRGGVSGTIYIYHSGDGTYSSGLKFRASASRGGGNYNNDPWTYEAKGAVYGSIPLTSIDRTAGTPTISNVSSTYNSASCNITVPFASTVNQYSRDGSNWSNWNKSVSANSAFSDSWSGLSPNTTYTFYYRFRRDYNQVWSPAVSFRVTTKKPATGNANNISISVSSTYNSATISLSGGSPGAGGSIGYYRINFNGGGYKKVSNPATFTGLSPNTTYNFSVDFADNYGTIAAGSTAGSVTTKKPAAPSKGSVSVSLTTYNSITYSWSKFSFGAGATWGEYQISFNGGAWTSVGANTSYTASNLSPNTSYTLNVKLKDNYGQYSGESSVTGTTTESAAPTAGTISVSNITPFGATFSWSGFNFGAGATWGKYQYGWHDTEWYDCGQSTSITLSDRKPNTSNTFYVRLIDNYGKASPSVTVVVKTLKPTAPTAGTILVKNITHRGATLFWDGFAFGNGADFGKYQYNYNGFWLDCGTDTTVTLKNLSSNASYTFQVRLIDNYGTASNSVSITFKTKSEESWKYVNQYIKVNGTWKYGIVYYKTNGVWKTVTGTYFKGRTPTVALVDSNGSILTDSNGIILNAIQ